ncbi:MAG: hypothetical protein GKR89_15520 [Candidatus Latescibacteria bacterium]|nr:hypothetical protein [Candidatus Latescibacterota bacterium]
MNADRQQLMQDGYLILRQVIPPDMLKPMRAQFERLVERQKSRWQQEGSDAWETGAQPRLSNYQDLIDAETPQPVEFWLQDTTLGVARQLLAVPEATGIAGMMLMCSPQTNHGPAALHRDIHPIDMAPMGTLQADLVENGPKYLQWNVALYDDDVLCVVPGSHRRLNTEEENRCLLADNRAPLPGGVPVHLKAGDGVVYINFLLHWGSNYSTKLRRAITGGHTIFPHVGDRTFSRYLSPAGQAHFAHFHTLSEKLQDSTEAALRAVLDRDQTAYTRAVQDLQPGAGPAGRLVLAIYLCKAAQHIHRLKRPDFNTLPQDEQSRATSTHSISLNWGPAFADRFTSAQAEALWQRFAQLDDHLQGEEHFMPGYQSGPMRYYFEELRDNFSETDFLAAWSR